MHKSGQIVGIGDYEANGLINCPSVENQQWTIDWKKEQGIKGKKKEIVQNATKIHCSVYYILEKGFFFFVEDEWIDRVKEDGRFNGVILPLSRLPAFLNKTDCIVGHNFHKYDVPLMLKLIDYEYSGETIDTYVMSKVLWADRNKDGNGWSGHGLAAWGEYFGIPKPEYDEWETFDLDMLWRCFQDVKINVKAYNHLIGESKGWDWEASLKLENDVCGYIGRQETYGMPFNIELAKSRVESWMKGQGEIYTELRPMLSEEMDDAVGNSMLDIWLITHSTGKFKNYAGTFRKLGKHKMNGGPDDPIKEPRYLPNKGEKLTLLFSVNQDGYRVSSKNPQMKTRDAKGNLTSEVKKFYDDPKQVGGPFTPIIFNEPDIGSDDKLRKQLLRLGWEPDKTKEDEWTDSGLPRMTVKGNPVESLDKISGTAGRLLADFTVTKHRISQVVGLIGNVREDGRITAECNSASTNTARSAHSKVVNLPGVESKLGKEIRELFDTGDMVTEDGRPWVYINTDASGLEARALAHVINDPEITILICDPPKDPVTGEKQDFHTRLWNKIQEFSSSRGNTKTIEYGMFYGSGDEKIGKTCDIGPRPSASNLMSMGWNKTRSGNFKHPEKARGGVTLDSAQAIVIGTIVRKRILEEVPALGKAIEAAQEEASEGYVVGIDGRKLWMRQSFGKVQVHKSLNTKLQSLGAIVMTKATQLLNERCDAAGVRWQQICFYHDEWSILAHPDDAKEVGAISEQAIRDAGKFYDLNVDLDAEAAYGTCWADTH